MMPITDRSREKAHAGAAAAPEFFTYGGIGHGTWLAKDAFVQLYCLLVIFAGRHRKNLELLQQNASARRSDFGKLVRRQESNPKAHLQSKAQKAS
jgi:hypothetical protein